VHADKDVVWIRDYWDRQGEERKVGGGPEGVGAEGLHCHVWVLECLRLLKERMGKTGISIVLESFGASICTSFLALQKKSAEFRTRDSAFNFRAEM
jgi:hypothetical protein